MSLVLNQRGVWNSGVTYQVGDAVVFGGFGYYALTSNTNSQPPSANWQQYTNIIAAAGTSLLDASGNVVGVSGSPLHVVDDGALAANTDSIALGPNSTTGATPYYLRYNTAGALTLQTIKASAGTLYSLVLLNFVATNPVFVSIFDNAAPTLGTTAPIHEDFLAAGGGSLTTVPGRLAIDFGPLGLKFSNAITFFATSTENSSTGITTAAAAPLIVSARYA